jgi:dipeptidyl aminopeptidase/acylaminoacyl peptidase
VSLAALLVWGVLPLPAVAQEAAAGSSVAKSSAARVEEVLRGFHHSHFIESVAISPNGKRLAWIENGTISVAPLDDLDKRRRVTAGVSDLVYTGCTERELAWSPDSSALAFFSDCSSGAASSGSQDNLFLASLDGSPAKPLTSLHGYVHAPIFSPDGRQIAFLYVEGATRPAGALAAMKPPSGVIGEDGIEIQRIAVAQVDAPAPVEPAFVSPANLHVYEFDWSPDSLSLAYIAAAPPGENNWWVAKLYAQPLGSSPFAVLAPAEVPGPLHGLQIAVPRWSPDGKAIAFIGGLMSDQGVTGGDLYLIPASGGRPQRMTARKASVAWFHWDPVNQAAASSGSYAIRLIEIRDGALHLVSALKLSPGATGEAQANDEILDGTIFSGELTSSESVARDGTEAFVFSSFSKPPEIWIDRGGKSRQITHFNDGVEPSWGKSVSVDWTSDNFRAQGWLMLPKNYDPARKYPMIVQVHGGPAAAVIPHWGAGSSLSPQVFSALGYFVFMPNPRGSYGQGEEFTEANRKDFGYGDLRDILAGVDAVEARYAVDPNRIGVDGWSYGGFMTMFAITQTHRFKAAVAGAGISDWLSYYGENSIDQWMIPYFGASVYDDPSVYAKSSPIGFIKQAHTPTLIVVGDRDGECPAPQSFEFWHALRALGVPTEFVVYPNEGHGFADPAHRRDVLERAAGWFLEYMPPGS